MTWSYDLALSAAKDKVRLLLGDTNTNDQRLQDEEITFFLGQNSSNIYSAAIACARALAGKYANMVNTTVESLSVNYSDRAKFYQTLITTLQNQADAQDGGVSGPIVTGISISAMEAVDADPDRVPNKFTTDMDSDPAVPFSQSLRSP